MRKWRAFVVTCGISILGICPAPTAAARVYCYGDGVSICGISVPLPFNLPVGGMTNLTLPSPFKRQSFTVACLGNANNPFYQIVNPDAIDCSLPKCEDSTLTVCGHSFFVKGGNVVGTTVKVNIPPSSVIDSYKNSPQSFTAQCVNPDNPAFHVDDTNNVTCNAFPCDAGTVSLCGHDIPVPGGAPMGQVLNLTMPPPFTPDPFQVECLGTNGLAPAYQLIAHDAVQCLAK